MVSIPEIWSPHQKYKQNTRNMVVIPKVWSTYQKYGHNTRIMVNIPEIWPPYQKYGQNTRIMVNIPDIWSTYQKYGHHTRSIVNIPEIWSKYQKCVQYTRNMVTIVTALEGGRNTLSSCCRPRGGRQTKPKEGQSRKMNPPQSQAPLRGRANSSQGATRGSGGRGRDPSGRIVRSWPRP